MELFSSEGLFHFATAVDLEHFIVIFGDHLCESTHEKSKPPTANRNTDGSPPPGGHMTSLAAYIGGVTSILECKTGVLDCRLRFLLWGAPMEQDKRGIWIREWIIFALSIGLGAHVALGLILHDSASRPIHDMGWNALFIGLIIYAAVQACRSIVLFVRTRRPKPDA